MMRSVWVQHLTYRKSLEVNVVMISGLPGVQKFLQVSAASVVYDGWLHAAGHSMERGQRAVFVTC